jgi:hypothetical protein
MVEIVKAKEIKAAGSGLQSNHGVNIVCIFNDLTFSKHFFHFYTKIETIDFYFILHINRAVIRFTNLFAFLFFF